MYFFGLAKVKSLSTLMQRSMLQAATLLNRPTKESACELIVNNDGADQALAISVSSIIWRNAVPFKILRWLDDLISSPVTASLENALDCIRNSLANPLDVADYQLLKSLKECIQDRLSTAYRVNSSSEARRMTVAFVDTLVGVGTNLIDDTYISHAIYISSQDALFASVPNLINATKSSNSCELVLAQAIYCNASGSHDQAIKEFDRYFEACPEDIDPPEWAFVKYVDSCLRMGRDRQYIDAHCNKFASYSPSVVISIANRIKGSGVIESSLPFFDKGQTSGEPIAYYRDSDYTHSQSDKCAALTIVSQNYLALALTLANSFLDTHQDSLFFIVIVDSHEGIEDLTKREGLYFIPYECIQIPDLRVFMYRYSILELNTAVKPYALSYVFDKYPQLDKLLYIDPDIKVYACLRDVWDALDIGNICLTPHLLSPINDKKSPSEINILQSGSYNLGFIGIRRSNDSEKLLEWWKERLFLDCRVDIPAGLFTDQKWIDLIPGYFEKCIIIRQHEYNVAYWNLHERSCQIDSSMRAYINNRPLRFFHFSGYSPAKPNIISKHQDRHQLANRKDLQPLFNDYAKCLTSNGHLQLSKIPYKFDYLPCGIKNSRVIRWVLDSASRCEQTIVPNLSDKRLVLDFLTKINTRITNGVILPPILAGIINIRKDVGSYFSFFNGSAGDLNGLINWCITAGCTEEDLQTFVDALIDENIRLSLIKTSDVQTVVDAWESRQDLQDNLGLFWKSSESIQRLKGWLEGSGLSELGISMNRITSISKAFSHGAEKLLHVYFMRSDLQEVFPRIYDYQTLESLSNWMRSNIRQIPNTTHDDVDAFLFVYGKHVDILPLALRNSQWIRNFIPEPREDVNKAILDAIGVEESRYECALDLIRSKIKQAPDHIVYSQAESPLKINIAGNFSASTGIGQSVRTLCKSLENLGRPVAQAKWTLPSLYSFQAAFDCSSLLGNSIHDYADLSIAVCNADSTLYLRKQIPQGFWNASRKVGYWVWETERLPESMLEGYDIYDEIWTPSEYSACSIRSITRKPVYVVPHSLPTEAFIDANREKIVHRIRNWKLDRSLKLGYFYDSKSYSERKNPDAFLDLAEALQADGLIIEPIIKVSSPSFGDYNYEKFIHRARELSAKIILKTLSDTEIYNLYLELDIYVSLHRSEGFGLTCAEALSLGVLTIATGYSGNLDFMNSENSLLVASTPYVLSKECGPYQYGTIWGDPCIHDAKNKIMNLISKPYACADIMAKAFKSVGHSLSSEVIGQIISNLLSKS